MIHFKAADGSEASTEIVANSDVTFPTLSAPWTIDGTVYSPDPGVPLTEYAASIGLNIWRAQPSVRKVVDFIARSVASIPLKVYERVADTERTPLNDDPLALLLRTPFPAVTQYRLIHNILTDLCLYDRYLLWRQPSADSVSGYTLRHIPARRFRLKDDGWGAVTGAVVMFNDGTSRTLPLDQLVFDHGYGGANGIPPVETLANILQENTEAVNYRRAQWKNQARVPSVIERPADARRWDKESRDRFHEGWRNFTAGGGREGGTPILEDGMTLKSATAFSPKETQDLEGRKLTDAEVASSYHIAPELVGARQANYSNMASLRQTLYRDSLGPIIYQLEQAFNAMLTPVFAGYRELYIEANVDAKLRASFEEQAAVTSAATGGPWMTRNEARAMRNLPPVPDGDELIVPMNVTEGGLASPRDTAPEE